MKATVYVCSQGHRTPAADVKRPGPVIGCPFRIGTRMQCGANARLTRPADPAPKATR